MNALRTLPSFAAVRAFEATARLGSCKAAAAALYLTESAVSHQIRRLESELGVTLFQRRHRALVLTEAGAALYADVGRALDSLAEAFARLRQQRSNCLSISVLPGFAVHWLIPRLAGFYAAHPGLELRLSSTERLVDFDAEAVDVAIRYGAGQWPGLTSALVLAEWIAPVCTPQALKRWAIRTPADVTTVPRIANLQHPDEWSDWARDCSLPPPPAPAVTMEHSPMVLEAARSGLGVAMGRSPMVDADLAAGALVCVQPPMPSGQGYWLVHPPRHGERQPLQDFARWLCDQAHQAGASSAMRITP